MFWCQVVWDDSPESMDWVRSSTDAMVSDCRSLQWVTILQCASCGKTCTDSSVVSTRCNTIAMADHPPCTQIESRTLCPCLYFWTCSRLETQVLRLVWTSDFSFSHTQVDKTKTIRCISMSFGLNLWQALLLTVCWCLDLPVCLRCLKGMWNDHLHVPVINSPCNMEQFSSLYPVPKTWY